jgi:hypothetical protein
LQRRNFLIYGKTNLPVIKKLQSPKPKEVSQWDKLANIPKIGETSEVSTEKIVNRDENTKVSNSVGDLIPVSESAEKLRREQIELSNKRYRYETRKSADEFIVKLLNLSLFNQNSVNHDPIPDKFENYTQYRNIWYPLFEYESFCQLVSLRSEGSKSKLVDSNWTAAVHYNNEEKPF